MGQIILAIAPEDRELFDRRYQASVAFMNIKVIDGGDERCDTVARALEAVEESCDYIAVHDAARPCLSAELIEAVFAAAQEHGAALPASPVAETIKRAADGRFATETVSRVGLYLAQTPQAFERRLLCRAYAGRDQAPSHATDDCQLVEALGERIAVVPGSALNIKITTQLDLKLAAAILPLLEQPSARPRDHIRSRTNARCGPICPS